jgi:hypothetical protein
VDPAAAADASAAGAGGGGGGGGTGDVEGEAYVNRQTFTCPLCVEDGLVRTGREDHPGRASPGLGLGFRV